ncbi:hypothetical protein Taro_038777 [Colocasia esculenta]|uniref:HAT C-terminal dimerisation domain-containing protein n=1 Tax=Colocasia esculenta TaxID=4460 RepID=A0A843W8Z4_COLES|nr:hypothetical protein [Colocasia esculenta]
MPSGGESLIEDRSTHCIMIFMLRGISSTHNTCIGLTGVNWWLDHGRTYEYENLAYVAIWVLSQTTSAIGCERNWSTFGLIHTKQRNSLKSARLEKLVFCHYNMRLKLKISNYLDKLKIEKNIES